MKRKVTEGYVIQDFDDDENLVNQWFEASDRVGGTVECYHPFEMVTPRTHLRICRGDGWSCGTAHYWDTRTGENVPEPKGEGFASEFPCPACLTGTGHCPYRDG